MTQSKSRIAMTLEDHQAIRSTPPKILVENPEVPHAELMSDAETLDYLEFVTDMCSHQFDFWIEELELTITCLRQLGRLPAEFSNPSLIEEMKELHRLFP